ncbi:metallopeptidase family protein [Nocardioides sp. GY 10127]|uniref:metallopeptidase family protein n=1 Tax=Nocardioides sp. GY 10127 TaxID=2569762 RepID=UPI0010A7E0C7|nr:metallopeptidase family protein [Nocardioides sp. GY 10127]TIC84227.1 metallopeptidase family protein [Nocardioides sp. GY 10127]
MPSQSPRRRDRHGRGRRGPVVSPGPLPAPLPLGRGPHRTSAERFDDLVLDVADLLEARWGDKLAELEWAVEDVPVVPPEAAWDDPVPLARLLRAPASAPRLVVFRRPLELRATHREELASLVHTAVVEEVARYLELPPEDVDPDYDPGDD